MPQPPCALIFDMDDTLVASGDIWQRAETRLYHLLGHPYSPEIAARYKGMNALDVGRTMHRHLHPSGYTAEECAHTLRRYLLEEFQGAIIAKPGADTLLRRVAGPYPLALASGSPLEAIQRVLAYFQWTSLFSVVISSESVPHGKPAPDVFLEAARLADCPPARALVFEDSLHGVHAARAAGMACFVVPSTPDPRIASEADRAFISLDSITLADIER